MSGHSLDNRLEQLEKKLDMWVSIDKIRDTAPDPAAMLTAIAELLVARFDAALCLLALADQETEDLELQAISDRGRLFAKLGKQSIGKLAARGMKAKEVRVWKGEKVLPEAGVEKPPGKLEIAAVPIVMRPGERLGVVLLFRADRPFEKAEVELLEAAESQIDSAVIQAHNYYQLQQRNKELEVIYKIDRIRDQDLPFEEMLQAALRELNTAIESEMAFIMLYKTQSKKLEMGAATHAALTQEDDYRETVERISYEALVKAEIIYHNNLSGKLRSAMCIPLILQEKILGVFGMLNSPRPGGFDREDRRLLTAIASQLDTAIFESVEQRHLMALLGRAVDPRVMERLLADPDIGFLKGERTFLSVLFADIRGSTSLAERTEPELLVGFINDYLGQMSDVVLRHEGTVDKFVGDEVVALFSAPFYQEDHAIRAVRVGLDMQKAHHQLMESWKAKGLAEAPIGVGIATGELIAGEMGSPQRTDYTAIGAAANLGARICSIAEAGQVLVSQTTYDLIKDRIEAEPISDVHVKGISGEITVYHVTRVLD